MKTNKNLIEMIYLLKIFQIKKTLLIAVLIAFASCSSSDDIDNSIDTSLLYGQWYRVGLCQEQNSLLLNSNKSYVSFHSGAVNCEDPEPDTYKYTGTFEVSNGLISYSQSTIELIIDGTNLTVHEFPNPDIKREITILTETALEIKTTIDRGNNVIEILSTANYEH